MKRLKGIYFQLVVLYAAVLVCASIIPTLITETAFGGISNKNVANKLESALEFMAPGIENGTVSPELISGVLYLFDTEVQVSHDAGQSFRLPGDALLKLDRNSDGLLIAILPVPGGSVVISADLDSSVQRLSDFALALRFLFLFAGLIFIGARAYRVIPPVWELERAAKHVASGDFSIRMPVTGVSNELDSLIASFNAMAEELSKVEELRSGFIHDVSHEFKIPLTTISGYARILEVGCTEEEAREYSSIIIEETTRLSRLVDNILILNKLDRFAGQTELGQTGLELEKVQLSEQVRRVLTMYEPIWSGKGISFQFNLDETEVIGCESLLMQIWTNLIDNAVKFTPEGGKVRIFLEWDSLNDGVVFIISDTGGGMEAEQERHIFDTFYQADNSRGTEGNGLGLAIVNRIVQVHGGAVMVKSIPGEGTTFTVRLPYKL